MKIKGRDNDEVDVFIGPVPESEVVFVVDQIDPNTNQFDECKILIGWENEQEAREGYLANYDHSWRGLSAITPMSWPEFDEWLKNGGPENPAAKIEWQPSMETYVSGGELNPPLMEGTKALKPSDIRNLRDMVEAYDTGRGIRNSASTTISRLLADDCLEEEPGRPIALRPTNRGRTLAQGNKALSAMSETAGGALVPPARWMGRKPNGRVKLLRQKYKSHREDCERQGKPNGYSAFGGCGDHGSTPQDKALADSIRSVAAKLASAWAKFEERYGRRAALSMALAGIATFPIPGNLALIIAAAEAIRGLSGYSQKNLGDSPLGTIKPATLPVTESLLVR